MASPQTGKLSVTTSNTSVAFSPSVVKVILWNTGGIDAYINLNGVATTSLFPIGAGEKLEIGLASAGLTGAIASVQAIAASSTTTVNVIGVESWQ